MEGTEYQKQQTHTKKREGVSSWIRRQTNGVAKHFICSKFKLTFDKVRVHLLKSTRWTFFAKQIPAVQAAFNFQLHSRTTRSSRTWCQLLFFPVDIGLPACGIMRMFLSKLHRQNVFTTASSARKSSHNFNFLWTGHWLVLYEKTLCREVCF